MQAKQLLEARTGAGARGRDRREGGQGSVSMNHRRACELMCDVDLLFVQPDAHHQVPDERLVAAQVIGGLGARGLALEHLMDPRRSRQRHEPWPEAFVADHGMARLVVARQQRDGMRLDLRLGSGHAQPSEKVCEGVQQREVADSRQLVFLGALEALINHSVSPFLIPASPFNIWD